MSSLPYPTELIELAVRLGDSPEQIRASYSTLFGVEHARLYVGTTVTLHITRTDPAALRKLAAAALELADWREQQDTARQGVPA